MFGYDLGRALKVRRLVRTSVLLAILCLTVTGGDRVDASDASVGTAWEASAGSQTSPETSMQQLGLEAIPLDSISSETRGLDPSSSAGHTPAGPLPLSRLRIVNAVGRPALSDIANHMGLSEVVFADLLVRGFVDLDLRLAIEHGDYAPSGDPNVSIAIDREGRFTGEFVNDGLQRLDERVPLTAIFPVFERFQGETIPMLESILANLSVNDLRGRFRPGHLDETYQNEMRAMLSLYGVRPSGRDRESLRRALVQAREAWVQSHSGHAKPLSGASCAQILAGALTAAKTIYDQQ